MRHWLLRAYNNADESLYPALTFDGTHTLNWTFTEGFFSEPAHWVVEKSACGYENWTTHATLASGARTENIAGTGTRGITGNTQKGRRLQPFDLHTRTVCIGPIKNAELLIA